MPNNRTPDEIPDLGKLGTNKANQILSVARSKMPPGTETVMVIWVQPDGNITWHHNAVPVQAHLMGSVVAATAMKIMTGG